LKKERITLKKLRAEGKKDLTKGIGMHKILSKMDRKRIQQVRRQKRKEKKEEKRLAKSACIQRDS